MGNPIISLVFDHKGVATKTKEGLVQIKVYYKRDRKYFSTGVRVYSDQWSEKYYVRNRADAVALNEQIELSLNKARDCANEVVRTSGSFVWDKFVALMKLNSQKASSFIEFVADRIEKRGNRESTQRQHWVFHGSLNEFALIQTFNDLNTVNINKYEDWLRQKGITQTTIYAYMKRFKVYVAEAVRFGLLDRNPFDGVHYDRGKPKGRKYLTKEELDAIRGLDLNDTLSKVRDTFLFMCYTSLAYSDAAKFDFKKDVFERDGKFVFEDKRQKTDEEYFIVLIPQAMEILAKYDYKLPFFANQRMNDYLKVIAQFAGIKKPISTHYARHTGAMLALNNGVRIEAVQRMLGHANVKTTQVYAKMRTEEVEKAYDTMKDVW